MWVPGAQSQLDLSAVGMSQSCATQGHGCLILEGPSWDTSVFYRNSLQVPMSPERHTKSTGHGPLRGSAPLTSISHGSQDPEDPSPRVLSGRQMWGR